MIELQRNFLQGVMNKDIDPHFLPDGQYRDALNIIVGDSDDTFGDGSHNGVAQNYLGNTLKNSSLGLTNAQCIGALSFPPNSVIYWLIASDYADLIVEYNELIDLTTVVLKATKVNATTPSILNFNKDFYVTGINYINGLLFWTDNYNPPRRINIERAKNYAVDGFNETDISVIVKPPLSAPSIEFTINGEANNLENKFIYFAYRYKYIDNEYSSLSPFSPVAFYPKPFDYDYGVSENISMVNAYNTAIVRFNTGGPNVKEVQLVYRDTASLNTYVIDNIDKRANGYSNNVDETFEFKNNKVYTLLPQDQVTRLFDNVPLKAKAQELIGSRLVYGNYTQFFDLVDCDGEVISPAFELTHDSINVSSNPLPTFKSNRDYEVGIEYLDDYGRVSTVVVPILNTNTEYIPADKATKANNLRVTIDENFKPPCFATYYRFVIKQDKQEYYNLFPLTYFSDGEFKWFLINQADVDKISVGSYLYLKTSSVNTNIQYKVLDVISKSANFLNNSKEQPAGVYFKIKIDANLLSPVYYYSFTNISSQSPYIPIVNRFSVAEKAIFYGSGANNMVTSNGNAYSGINDIRFKVEVSDTNKFKYYAFVEGIPYVYVNEVTITPGVNQTLSYTYNSITYSCTIQFSSISGLNLKDYWVVNCRSNGIGTSGFNIFGGRTEYTLHDCPYGFVTGDNWNLDNTYVGDREIKAGAVITIKMKEPNNGDTTLTQTFLASKDYVNIEEWFIEGNIYLTWKQYQGAASIGAKNVCFRRINVFSSGLVSTQYSANQGGSISSGTLDAPVFMWIYGYTTGSNPTMEVIFDFQESEYPSIFETVPTDTNQDIYYELSQTFAIENGNHTGNYQDQVVGTTPAIIDLNKVYNLYDNRDFNAFSFGNGVESFRIRDDWNAATMQFSPRANSTIEGYEQQTLVQALTYSGVYTQTTAINRLNEFNLSLGNFKYLDRFFGSIQKLHSRDTDIVVFQENKVSKVLYGKNLISDSVGGGTIASIPEVLGTQIAYTGEYGISFNPESFAIWGNDMFFTDARRGAVLRLGDNGLFEISSQGMKNWFKANLDPGTIKLGMMDPYFEHYVLANNDRPVNACVFEISDTTVTFAEGAGSQSIVITSNNEWYIEVPENDWLTVSPKYGNDKQTITLTATSNMGSLRSLILSIFGCSGTNTVTVTQAAHTTTTSTTTTSTTSTTTLPPVYYYYGVRVCGGLEESFIQSTELIDITNVVKIDGVCYEIISIGGDAGTLLVDNTKYIDCEACASATTTTSTTTTTTTTLPPTYYYFNATPCGGGEPVLVKSLILHTIGTVGYDSVGGVCYVLDSSGEGSTSIDVTETVPDCSAPSCGGTTTTTSTTTTTTVAPTCTLYRNNETYDVTGVNYTTCAGDVLTDMTLYGTDTGGGEGQSICAQDGTLGGSGAAYLTNIGSCT